MQKNVIGGRIHFQGVCMEDCKLDGNRPEDPKGIYKKFASRVHKITEYNPEFHYIRFRAIGNLEIDGPNNNWDGFPYEDFEDSRPGMGYQSFIGKKAFIEHGSHSIENAIGELPGAFLNSFHFPNEFRGKRYAELDSFDIPERQQILAMDDQTDGSVEVLMAIDRQLSPRISRMVDSNQHLSCSMGTNIAYSVCTACGNQAHYEYQYCPHIQFAKGGTHLIPARDYRQLITAKIIRPEWLPKILATDRDVRDVLEGVTNRMITARAFEINKELSFFELSVVANAAYIKGQMLEKVATTEDGSLQLVDIQKLSNIELLVLGIQTGAIDVHKISEAALRATAKELEIRL